MPKFLENLGHDIYFFHNSHFIGFFFVFFITKESLTLNASQKKFWMKYSSQMM